MDIIISHKSALEYWRLHAKEKQDFLKKQCRKKIPFSCPKISELCEALPSELTYPIDLLIANSISRRKSIYVRPHVYGGPTNDLCFREICDGISVTSPPFCFFQMAGDLSLIKLIELGFEFCGTYSLSASGESGKKQDAAKTNKNTYGHTPLTTTKDLKIFTSRMKGISGQTKVSRALRYIVDGSASPMETILTMLLTLPYKLGGYGLPMPELNKKVYKEKSSQYRSDKDYYVCDLIWPKEKLAIEYDSNMYHTGADRIKSDSKKRLDLAVLGIDVITVTSDQVRKIEALEDLAKLIAGKLKKRLRYNQYDDFAFWKTQRELHKLILRISSR